MILSFKSAVKSPHTKQFNEFEAMESSELSEKTGQQRQAKKARPVTSPQQAKLVSHTKFKNLAAAHMLQALKIHLFTQIFLLFQCFQVSELSQVVTELAVTVWRC